MGGERPRASTNPRQHPDLPLSPTPTTLTPEQECRTMPLSPQPRQPALTNGDQTVTKVGKTCHRQPLRRTPNNPEQIRTDPNTAERPDQIGAPPNHPQTPRKKSTLNTAAAHPQRPTLYLTSSLPADLCATRADRRFCVGWACRRSWGGMESWRRCTTRSTGRRSRAVGARRPGRAAVRRVALLYGVWSASRATAAEVARKSAGRGEGPAGEEAMAAGLGGA